MHQINIALACIGGAALVLGLFTNLLRRYWLSEPLVALVLGAIIGPAGLGWLDLQDSPHQHQVLEQVARLTLAVALINVALRLPHRYLLREWSSVAMLAGLAMVLMWIASSAIVGLILQLDIVTAMLIGAVITPTDPVLAGGIVTGRLAERYLPLRTRSLLSAESGANDGLAYPLVLLPALLATRPAGEAWRQWLTVTLPWEVLAAVAIGAGAGYLIARTENWSVQKGYTERTPLLTVALALALAVTGMVHLLGSDEILSVFVAGIMLDLMRTDIEQEQGHIEEVIKEIVQLPVFVLLGAVLPWQRWQEMGWLAPAVVVAVLLLRRIPVLLALKPLTSQIPRWDEAVYLAWFGPIGVAAVYYAMLAHRHTHAEQVWPVASLVIAASVVVHGLTATPLTKALGRRSRPEILGTA